MAVERDMVTQFVAEAFPQGVPQPAQRVGGAGKGAFREVAGRSQRDDRRDTLRTRPPPTLVAGPMEQGLQRDAIPNIERPDPLRRVDLVAGNRQQVHPEIVDVDRDLPHRLRDVSVDKGAAGVGEPRHLRNVLDRAHLVVGVHDADEQRRDLQRPIKRLQVDDAVAVDRQARDPAAEALKKGAWLEGGGMFDRARDDVHLARGLCRHRTKRYPFDRQIARLRPTAGEHDLLGSCAQQDGHLGA